MKLILGTAEFGKAYGEGIKEKPSFSEVRAILKYAITHGIDTLDTADSYGCEYLADYFLPFKVITKTRDVAKLGENILYHYLPYESSLPLLWGASIYNMEQFDINLRMVQVPYNLEYREFMGTFHKGPLVYVRSIFKRGELLKKGYTVSECLRFVMKQPVDGIIVGINKLDELKEIIEEWNK